MPTYEYACSKCGHEFEIFQSMKDKPLAACPRELCGMKRWGKGAVKKKMGAGAGLIFKGSGFYITDYRSENYKQAAKKDAPASSGESKSGGEKKSTETKASGKESKPSGSSKTK